MTIMPTQARDAMVAQATETLRSALSSMYPGGVPQNRSDKIRATIEGYSDATLERIQQYSWSVNSAYFLTVGMINGWDETKANDYIAVTDALNLDEGVRMFQHESWKHYPDLFPADNEGDYPEERLSQLVALYRVTKHMDDKGLEPYYDNDLNNDIDSTYVEHDELRDFLLHPEEPYKREDIVHVIITNSVYDPDRIKAMLDNGTPSLTSGIL